MLSNQKQKERRVKRRNPVKMSFLTKMFGGGKKETTINTSEAIQNLRDTENLLIKKQEYLEKKVEQEIETAKKNGVKNKRGEHNVNCHQVDDRTMCTTCTVT